MIIAIGYWNNGPVVSEGYGHNRTTHLVGLVGLLISLFMISGGVMISYQGVVTCKAALRTSSEAMKDLLKRVKCCIITYLVIIVVGSLSSYAAMAY